MIDINELEQKWANLNSELAEVTRQISAIKERPRREALERIEQIQNEVVNLIKEGRKISQEFDIPLEFKFGSSDWSDILRYSHGYWNTSSMEC